MKKIDRVSMIAFLKTLGIFVGIAVYFTLCAINANVIIYSIALIGIGMICGMFWMVYDAIKGSEEHKQRQREWNKKRYGEVE